MIRILYIALILTGPLTANCQLSTATPWHGKERTIHYRPEGKDFVTTNGALRFNRALYGGNTAFRVEAGDLPELALYLPGMGGNCKLGIIAGNNSKWLTEAKNIKAIYRPGAMLYEIKDPLLGAGTLLVTVLATYDQEAMIIQVVPKGITTTMQLFSAFGGVTGKKFSRDGDIGADPESSFYLQPAYCVNNVYDLQANSFTVRFGEGAAKKLEGVFPTGMSLHTAHAGRQQSPLVLDRSAAVADTTLVCGTVPLKRTDTLYFMVRQLGKEATAINYTDLPALFRTAEAARKNLAARIQVNTPDPYINTLGGALSIAADAIWDSPTYMHGAVAWRMRLPAWRGAYAADPLGWHDRARTHFSSYALSQLTSPLTAPVVADTALHLARQQEKIGNALFSSGYICRNPNGDIRPHHYDMNLVFIDQLFTHFCWTGDTAYIREMWPVIERHLAWEKRNFDADNDGLYDAYCCIWASDALQYSGGGVTHSSAYNYRANMLAAQLAGIAGKEGNPYQQEAAKIYQAIHRQLWLPQDGWYAEYKDLLGRQMVHPAAGLWTIYHAIDSKVPDAFKAWQSLRYIDTKIPHIPVQAKGITGNLFVLSTTNWQPYTWSINNVALAENLHTALAYWQGNRAEDAYRLWKSALVESMYIGASPGNFQQLPFYDAIRGELYRDFADPVGMAARSLVEGLFGVQPDALHDTLTIQPGLPVAWNTASLQVPDLQFDFKRDAIKDQYILVPAFAHNMHLRLRVRMRKTGIQAVTVNGKAVTWKVKEAIGEPLLEITVPKQARYSISITWKGATLQKIQNDSSYVAGEPLTLTGGAALIQDVYDPQQALDKSSVSNNRLQATLLPSYGDKTVFVRLRQGDASWWQPLCFTVKPPVVVIPLARQDSTGIYFILRNHTAAVKGTLVINPGPRMIRMPLEIAARGVSPTVHIPAQYLITGSNQVQFEWGNNNRVSTTILNWSIPSIGIAFEKIDLSAQLNARITKIFEQVYLSPRPVLPTLQLPTQGIGNWCYPLVQPVINDEGLRRLASNNNELNLDQHIPFATPGDTNANNILFTSQWDNYPDSAVIALSGRASHAYLIMAGSTNPMQSRLVNGEVRVQYTDGSADTLVLKNPQNWWPIEQDYYTDGYAFTTDAPTPLRLYLKTGHIGTTAPEYATIKGFSNRAIDGGAATILDLPLDAGKELKSLSLHAIANDVVIGLMSVTLVRN